MFLRAAGRMFLRGANDTPPHAAGRMLLLPALDLGLGLHRVKAPEPERLQAAASRMNAPTTVYILSSLP